MRDSSEKDLYNKRESRSVMMIVTIIIIYYYCYQSYIKGIMRVQGLVSYLGNRFLQLLDNFFSTFMLLLICLGCYHFCIFCLSINIFFFSIISLPVIISGLIHKFVRTDASIHRPSSSSFSVFLPQSFSSPLFFCLHVLSNSKTLLIVFSLSSPSYSLTFQFFLTFLF